VVRSTQGRTAHISFGQDKVMLGQVRSGQIRSVQIISRQSRSCNEKVSSTQFRLCQGQINVRSRSRSVQGQVKDKSCYVKVRSDQVRLRLCQVR